MANYDCYLSHILISIYGMLIASEAYKRPDAMLWSVSRQTVHMDIWTNRSLIGPYIVTATNEIEETLDWSFGNLSQLAAYNNEICLPVQMEYQQFIRPGRLKNLTKTITK